MSKQKTKHFKVGFKTKLIVMTTLVSAIMLITSNWYSYSQLKEALQHSIFNEIDHSLTLEASKIERNVKNTVRTVEAVANEIKSSDRATPKEILMLYGVKFGGISKIVVGYDDGRSYTSRPSGSFPNGIGIPEKYNPATRSWYKQAKQTLGPSFSNLFFTKSNNTPMIGVMYSFKDGVVMADLRFNEVESQLSHLDKIYQGKGVVVDENGMVVASTFEGIDIQASISSLSQSAKFNEAVNNPEQFFEGQLDGTAILVTAKAINLGVGKTWYMISIMEPSVVFSELEKVLFNKTVTVFFALLAVMAVMLLTVNKLYVPIISLRNIIRELSYGDGDLTQRLQVNSTDDLGQIASGVNRFIEHIQSLMLKIEGASVSLQQNVEQLEHQIDDNTHILKQHVQETELVVTAIDEMSSTADEVAQNAGKTAKSTKVASEMGEQSQQTVSLAKNTVNDLFKEVENTSSDLHKMSIETKGISDILKVIGDIADQTNLLALNAAIEAARAGEQGRGFAVVADEVRALASRTQDSTDEIEQTLKRLLIVNNNVVHSMENTKASCGNTISNTDNVGDSLNKLTTHVVDINDLSIQIATAAEEQSSVTQEISRNMNALNQIVTELNRNGESTLKQTNNIADVNQQLVTVVSQFKLK